MQQTSLSPAYVGYSETSKAAALSSMSAHAAYRLKILDLRDLPAHREGGLTKFELKELLNRAPHQTVSSCPGLMRMRRSAANGLTRRGNSHKRCYVYFLRDAVSVDQCLPVLRVGGTWSIGTP